MAGGPSTSELVVAANNGGALGMLAGGYKTAELLAHEIASVRAATDEAFGVNLFIPGPPTSDDRHVAAYVRSLDSDAAALGTACGAPGWDDDHFDEKLELVIAMAPPLVTFSFGCPSKKIVSSCHDAGSLVAVTVTKPQEARLATDAGADALCVQGIEAGGHRSTFVNEDQPGQDFGLLALIGEVGRVTDLPQIAAGGIVSHQQVRAVLAAGAVAAQCGTAFLRCAESGANAAYKAALNGDRYSVTVITRAFSGRPARGLLNGFIASHRDAPAAYPEINNATRALRAAAAEQGDTERMSLWAGQGFRSAAELPAGEIVERLCH
jgi:nitronate monooxygenase